MSLYDKPPSILDESHPPTDGSVIRAVPINPAVKGNYSDTKIAATIKGLSDHHEKQEVASFRGTDEGKKPVNYDYPRVVHSTKHLGDTYNVETEEQHNRLIATGDWSDVPMERVIEKRDGKILIIGRVVEGAPDKPEVPVGDPPANAEFKPPVDKVEPASPVAPPQAGAEKPHVDKV